MWDVYFSAFEPNTTRRVIEGVRDVDEAVGAALRLNASYATVSPCPSGGYYVVPVSFRTWGSRSDRN